MTQHEDTVTRMRDIGARRSGFDDHMQDMVFDDATHIANAQHGGNELDSPRGVEEGGLKAMSVLVDMSGVVVYVDDVVHVISVNDGTLEHDDTLSLSAAPIDDED